METPGKRIGRNIRAVREAAMYSRNHLAELSGVSASTIEDVELGLSARPRRTTIDRIARGLGVDAETLMEGAEVGSVPLGAAVPPSPDLRDGGLSRADELADLDDSAAYALLQTLPVDELMELQHELLMVLRYRYAPKVFATLEEAQVYAESEGKKRGDRVGERLRRVTGIIGERVDAEVREARERPLTHA
jgi:transcriptional regulator with XRE-family HTH domain